MNNEQPCDQVCKTLVDINNTLIKTLVDRITEALEHINTSLEVHGKVDEQLIKELESVTSNIKELMSLMSDTSVKEFVSLVNNLNIVRESDRGSVLDFLQRMSIAIGRWTPEEKNAIIDSIENCGGTLLTVKKKLHKIYFIVFTAGVTTILSQFGLPDAITKIINAIFSM